MKALPEDPYDREKQLLEEAKHRQLLEELEDPGYTPQPTPYDADSNTTTRHQTNGSTK